jgi:CDP-glycerol glycerophosphotransferase (TagB/SpsB family)
MLLYQFDSEIYFDKQYKPGYFSYKNDAFGKVLKQEIKLVEEIIKNVENGCIMEEEYVKRVDNTFYKIDKNNSKRVFEKIKEKFLKI